MKSGLSSQRLRQARHVPERRVPLFDCRLLVRERFKPAAGAGVLRSPGTIAKLRRGTESLYKTSV